MWLPHRQPLSPRRKFQMSSTKETGQLKEATWGSGEKSSARSGQCQEESQRRRGRSREGVRGTEETLRKGDGNSTARPEWGVYFCCSYDYDFWKIIRPYWVFYFCCVKDYNFWAARDKVCMFVMISLVTKSPCGPWGLSRECVLRIPNVS